MMFNNRPGIARGPPLVPCHPLVSDLATCAGARAVPSFSEMTLAVELLNRRLFISTLLSYAFIGSRIIAWVADGVVDISYLLTLGMRRLAHNRGALG